MSEILPTINDVQFRRITKALLPRFRGKLGSFAFITDDHMRLVVFDGSTLGGASKVALLESADFTCTPTAPNVDNVSSVADSAILNAHDIKALVEKLGSDDLANKIDHTIAKSDLDLNSEIGDGFYFVTNATNAPSNSTGHLLVYSVSGSVVQTWITIKPSSEPKTPEIYTRVKTDSSFTSWFKEITSAELNLDDIAYLSKDNIFYENVEIQGELTGPTIDSKLNHTITSSVTDLDLIVDDGIYYLKSDALTNAPSGVTESVLHVYLSNNTIFQNIISLEGKVFYRNKKDSGAFSPWTIQSAEVPEATSITPGIVKISDTTKSGDSTTAFSSAGAYVLEQKVESIDKQAEANQETITNLTQKVSNAITSVTIPNVTDESQTVVLPVSSGTVAIPMASATSFGVTRPATKSEVEANTDKEVYLTPKVFKEILDSTVEDKVEDVLTPSESGESTIINNIVNNVVEAIQDDLVNIQIVSDTDFSADSVKDKTLYLRVK